jgi:hypothetical protein
MLTIELINAVNSDVGQFFLLMAIIPFAQVSELTVLTLPFEHGIIVVNEWVPLIQSRETGKVAQS